jgi:nitrite reductase (NO-forming)
MGNTHSPVKPVSTNTATTQSKHKSNFGIANKSINRFTLITLGVALFSVIILGCSSSSSSDKDADPTVELIQTAAVHTAVPQDKNTPAALPIGNAGTWLPGQEDTTNPNDLQRVTQTLVAPPFLPEHDQVAKGAPKVIEVRLEVEEKLMEVGPGGAEIWGLTFNGTIPAPMIVAHQNDYIELTLVNPSTNQLQHNIDLHAATGAMGGGELTLVNPGQEITFRFKAVKPGVFVYHCAPGGPMIPFHVVSGMNGAIMVLPREGLADSQGDLVEYDKAYFVGEQDFYVPQDEDGNWKTYDSPAAALGDTIEVMKTLTPTHVVFNGSVGALTGDNALTSDVGEKVLLIHAQANRDSRPHLIGGHADLVWQGGSFSDLPDTNYETWFVPGGSAVAALYEFRQPGLYAYVSHNLIEAILLGAAAHIVVDGEWDDILMTQVSEAQAIK